MNNLGELSQAEIDLVNKHRKEKLRVEKANAMVVLALHTATAYEQWLQKEKRGSSFSTFCNEFGFDVENSADMFKVVEQLRRSAQDNTVSHLI